MFLWEPKGRGGKEHGSFVLFEYSKGGPLSPETIFLHSLSCVVKTSLAHIPSIEQSKRDVKCKDLCSVICILVLIVNIIPTFALFNVLNWARTIFLRWLYGLWRKSFLVSVGRILNRFSKDMGSMDELLPPAFFDAFTVGRRNFR